MSGTHELQSLGPFRANIPRIHAWIQRQLKSLKEDQKAFEIMLQLGMIMTQIDPERRPLLKDIVKELTAIERQHFSEDLIIEDEVE